MEMNSIGWIQPGLDKTGLIVSVNENFFHDLKEVDICLEHTIYTWTRIPTKGIKWQVDKPLFRAILPRKYCEHYLLSLQWSSWAYSDSSCFF